MFWQQDLVKVGKDVQTVRFTNNKGMTAKTFSNTHVKAHLKRLGLFPHTAFACLFDLLFRPTPAVLNMLKPELAILTRPDVVKIGIQLRIGDHVLRGHSLRVSSNC